MHDMHGPEPDLTILFQIASGQMGYFTSAQAREVGVSRSLLHHHARSGRFERVYRGVYRFRDFPSMPREEVAAAWLAVGKDASVVSHESALDLLELTDIIPNRIDVMIPRSRRYLRAPNDVTLHTTTRPVSPDGTTVRGGIRITNATRTIVDVTESGLSEEHVQRAVDEALHLGLSAPNLLRREAAARSQRVQEVIERAIEVAAT
jgi:predicted transcriptional regulator of viral defense system